MEENAQVQFPFHVNPHAVFPLDWVGIWTAYLEAGLRKLFKNPISERWGKQICLN
mgnify:FL=1